jgi:hypothetical protein
MMADRWTYEILTAGHAYETYAKGHGHACQVSVFLNGRGWYLMDPCALTYWKDELADPNLGLCLLVARDECLERGLLCHGETH